MNKPVVCAALVKSIPIGYASVGKIGQELFIAL